MALKRKAADIATDAAKKPKNASITSFFGAPKPNPNAPTTASNKAASSSDLTAPATTPIVFDKEAWVAKLSDEQKELLKLEIDTLHESWLGALKDEVTSERFLNLKRFLKKELESGVKVFPPMEDVYSWYVHSSIHSSKNPRKLTHETPKQPQPHQQPTTNNHHHHARSRHTPLPTVKAVILGQDPYHNHNQAHGLCFSVRPPTPAPPSLLNIYKCLKTDYPHFTPPPHNSGLLTPWSDRGVLLLNSCLTVRAHAANSHAKKGWEEFTQKVIDVVAAKRTKGVVFLAWGKPAEVRVRGVNGSGNGKAGGRHLVLRSPHPSPLSAHRGFFECGHFRKANEWLRERYGGVEGEIDWDLGVRPEEAGV